jgi:hypothetical protein
MNPLVYAKIDLQIYLIMFCGGIKHVQKPTGGMGARLMAVVLVSYE